MATLHVRQVPDYLYEALQRRAQERRSSIAKESIRLLSDALRTDRSGARRLFDEVEAGRPVARRGTPAAAALIRQDRERR